MILAEGKNPMTGTKNRSLQQWNEAKLKIVHSKPVDEDIRGSRSRNIKKLFIETNEGERFKFPIIQLEGARAMARHVGAGGAFHDEVGKYIIEIAEEFNDLRHISSHIYRNKNSLTESAFSLRESVRKRMADIRESFKNFMSKRSYIMACEHARNFERTLNEDSLDFTNIEQILNLSEDHDLNLNRLIGIINEDPVEQRVTDDDSDQNLYPKFTRETIRKAIGFKDLHSNAEVRDMENELEAAAQIMNTQNFTWTPKIASSEEARPTQMTSIARLRWRLGAMAERLDPTVPGQIVLSNILASIANKLDNPNEKGKVPVNVAEKEIVDIFVRVAPMIGENRYTTQEKTMNEIKEINEWFDNFDVTSIFKKPIKEETKEESNESDDSDEEIDEKIDESELFDRYFFIADSLARGLETPSNIKKKFNESQILDIAYVLNENWTSETTESIISKFGIDQEQLDEYSKFGGAPKSKIKFGRKNTPLRKAAMSGGEVSDDDEEYIRPSNKMFYPKSKDRMGKAADKTHSVLRDEDEDEQPVVENNLKSMRKLLNVFEQGEQSHEDDELLNEYFDTVSWFKDKVGSGRGKMLKPESKRRIQKMIDDGLSPREVARICGIDTRMLEKIMAASGMNLPESKDDDIRVLSNDKKGDFETDIDPDDPEANRFTDEIDDDKEAIKRQERY